MIVNVPPTSGTMDIEEFMAFIARRPKEERWHLIEGVAASNTRAEIDLKLNRYREPKNNLYVVLIEPREFHVEIFARARDWVLTVLARRDDLIDMPEFGLHCSLADLYRGTPLVPQYA